MVDVFQYWLNWFHFLFLKGGLLVILIDYTIFLSPFLDVTRMSMSMVSFLPQLEWNSLPIDCFFLTYDLSGFNSKINRHLLTVGSFYANFLDAVIFLCFFSCNSKLSQVNFISNIRIYIHEKMQFTSKPRHNTCIAEPNSMPCSGSSVLHGVNHN